MEPNPQFRDVGVVEIRIRFGSAQASHGGVIVGLNKYQSYSLRPYRVP